MKNKFVIMAAFAVILGVAVNTASAENVDFETVAKVIENCEPVSNEGPRGDYNIKCKATEELIEISKREPNSKFLSEIGGIDQPGLAADHEHIIINVVPEFGCYRLMGRGIDMAPEEDILYSVEVCPEE
jgi:hypothetical protein